MNSHRPLKAPEPTFRDLFTPKLVTVLREDYDLRRFQADAAAGLTVAIVALPLSMAIALVAAVVERRGYDGLVLATLIAGIILRALGFLRLGSYIKYIPQPVIIGFTAGIALIILASQLRDLLGLVLAGKEPAALIPKPVAASDAPHRSTP